MTAATARSDARVITRAGSDSDRRFRRAARHSQLIRFLRVAIPVGIVASFALLTVVMFFNPFKPPAGAAIDPGKLVVSGSKITMELPRLAGFTNDMKPYELNARTAAQDLSKPGVLELNEIRAQMQSGDQGQITISALTGIYDSKADQLRLIDKIVVRTGTGMEARLQEARVDVKKNTIVSESPVRVTFPEGTIDANRLDVANGGEVVLFSRGVVTYLDLSAEGVSSRRASAQ